MKRQVKSGNITIEYTLIQAHRRDILIQTLEGAVTRVYAPKTARLRDVDKVVLDHADQILSMREALKPVPLKDGDFIRVEGTPRRVRIEKGRGGAALSDDEFVIITPDITDDDAVRARARAFLSEFALRRIRQRLEYFHPLIGGEYHRVTVRAQRSRWGSCSSKHNLNFNWRLILAPPQCLDYVVIHELCHLTEFNHSPRFWSLVEKQMPDYKIWKEYLKTNGRALTF